ncbi:MAG TPA: AAA family ATPase [Streptosporangiaceae bacterium]|nr:AAA family ATPase [Streptosporangiaceae bacterium]
MPILCEPASSAGELLSGIDGEVRKADTLAAAAKLLDSDPSETLVIIGPRAVTSDAFAFAAALRLARPAVGVILARREVDVTLLMRAMQSGVRDVVPVGDDAAMSAACRRSYEVTRRMLAPPADEESAPGQIATVFAAKGGCGKTMLAVNLGVALARLGVRRVCVVDLDLSFGDVAISVQLDPARTILDALPMAGHLDESGAASLLTRYQPGLDMLLAPVTPGDAEKIPPRLVGELLAVLRGMYDFVVVDTPAQFNEHVLTAMDVSSQLVLLTTPDVTALKNLRVALDMLDMLSYPRQIRSVVVNRADSKVGLSLDHVRKVVRSEIAAHIPSSRAVPMSVNKGAPIVLDSPGHSVSQSVMKFAQQQLLSPTSRRSREGRSRGKRRVA